MNLRLRLIVVFFLLSVVPVGAITWYTYASNAQAIRDAARSEAEGLAAELSDRMRATTAQLSQRVESLMELSEAPKTVAVAYRGPATPRAPAREPAPARAPSPAPSEAPAAAPAAAPEPPAQPVVGHPTKTDLDVALGELAVLVHNIEVRGLRPGRRFGPPPEGFVPGVPPPGATPGGPAATGPEGRRPPRQARPGSPSGGGPAGRGGPPFGTTPEPADPNRILVDLREARRKVFEELVKDREAFDALPPEERQKVFALIDQRMQDMSQGIELLKKALAARALDVQTRDATAAVAAGVPSTPPVAPSPPPPPAEKAAATPPPARPPAARATAAPAPPPAAPTAAPEPAAPPPPAMKRSTSLSGRKLAVKVERGGQVVGQVDADVDLPKLLATVFKATPRDRGELPFAIGEGGEIYTANPSDKGRLEALRTSAVTSGGPAGTTVLADWIVATTPDPTGSRLKFGIARPYGEALRDLQASSARNAALGLGFVGLALILIVPLSSHLTRNLNTLSAGVHRIAAGDYSARVPVRSKDEIGRLAIAFNRMAADVEAHQRDAVSQERIRRELELGRQIQHDMLPRAPLQLGLTEIKGVSVPAREVGGDFFNYFVLRDGRIALIVGDVSGKGVGAALLMANLQAALRTRLSLGQDLASLAQELDVDIDRTTPGPVYSTLFVGILEPSTRQLRFVNAGHNPQYVLRTDGRLDRMASTGRPIGLLSGGGYAEARVDLGAGDVLFFYTDGCVEAENAAGDMFGAERLERALAESAGLGADQVMVAMESEVTRFRSGAEPNDDATMMVVKVG